MKGTQVYGINKLQQIGFLLDIFINCILIILAALW